MLVIPSQGANARNLSCLVQAEEMRDRSTPRLCLATLSKTTEIMKSTNRFEAGNGQQRRRIKTRPRLRNLRASDGA